MRLLRNNNANMNTGRNGVAVAQVSFSDSGGFGAVASSESRGAQIFAPRGISYRPCEGDRLLMLPVDGVETCVGCLSTATGIEGGELKLASAGGAVILLKNNGDISLNGLIVTKDGRLMEAAGGD